MAGRMMAGRSFRERRERLGLSMAALARKVDRLPASYVGMAERGEAGPSPTRRVRTALVQAELEQRARFNRMRREAAIEREWEQAPDCAIVLRIKRHIKSAVVQLYNECKFEEGDLLLELLPKDEATELLDWFFFDETDG